MDGTRAPLKEFDEVCLSHDAMIVVDESHATGSHSPFGMVSDLGLWDKHSSILASVHTYGKAWGGSGASVVCGEVFREWLVNYAKGQVFSTSLPVFTLKAIEQGYDLMMQCGCGGEGDERRKKLHSAVANFEAAVGRNELVSSRLIAGGSWIQGVVIPGNFEVVKVCDEVRRRGYEGFPIRSPTVEKGGERVRIVLHEFNSEREIEGLVEALGDAIENVEK